MVVWICSGLEACLFWSCMNVIVVRVKVRRGIVPMGSRVLTPVNRTLLQNNSARQYRYTSVRMEAAISSCLRSAWGGGGESAPCACMHLVFSSADAAEMLLHKAERCTDGHGLYTRIRQSVSQHVPARKVTSLIKP
jgi:hypothetical protein